MEAIDICGEQAAETLEVIRVAILRAGSNVFYANGVASRATVNSVVSAGDLRRVVRYFNRRKAKPISQIVKASAKISTEPVAQSYFAMCHTDMKSDIREIAGFTPVEQYSNSDRSLPGEIGKVEEIRFVCSALIEPFLAAGVAGTTYLSSGEIVAAATACDVYPILIVAQDAYGIVPLQGKNSVTPTVLNPDKPSKSDPLAQRGMVSWKTYHTACILNQNWLARVETACTAKP